MKFVFSDGLGVMNGRLIIKNFLSFCFWIYVGLGFISIAYIHLSIIFNGSMTLTMDALRPYEFLLAISISAIFITKGVFHIKKIFDDG
jgi:hypothetical protein